MKHSNHGSGHHDSKARDAKTPGSKAHGPAHGGEGMDRKLHNPIADKLIPLKPLDLGKAKSIDDLVRWSTPRAGSHGIAGSAIVTAMKTILEGRRRGHIHEPADLVAAHA